MLSFGRKLSTTFQHFFFRSAPFPNIEILSVCQCKWESEGGRRRRRTSRADSPSSSGWTAIFSMQCRTGNTTGRSCIIIHLYPMLLLYRIPTTINFWLELKQVWEDDPLPCSAMNEPSSYQSPMLYFFPVLAEWLLVSALTWRNCPLSLVAPNLHHHLYHHHDQQLWFSVVAAT